MIAVTPMAGKATSSAVCQRACRRRERVGAWPIATGAEGWRAMAVTIAHLRAIDSTLCVCEGALLRMHRSGAKALKIQVLQAFKVGPTRRLASKGIAAAVWGC